MCGTSLTSCREVWVVMYIIQEPVADLDFMKGGS